MIPLRYQDGILTLGALEFSMFLLDAEESGKPITQFPLEFLDLVTMTGHES